MNQLAHIMFFILSSPEQELIMQLEFTVSQFLLMDMVLVEFLKADIGVYRALVMVGHLPVVVMVYMGIHLELPEPGMVYMDLQAAVQQIMVFMHQEILLIQGLYLVLH